MKSALVLTLISSALVFQVHAKPADNEDKLLTAACNLISKELPIGQMTTLSPEECFSISSVHVSEDYDPTGKNPSWTISLSSGESKELKGTDLWLACEFSAKGQLTPENLELNWCSIEQ